MRFGNFPPAGAETRRPALFPKGANCQQTTNENGGNVSGRTSLVGALGLLEFGHSQRMGVGGDAGVVRLSGVNRQVSGIGALSEPRPSAGVADRNVRPTC